MTDDSGERKQQVRGARQEVTVLAATTSGRPACRAELRAWLARSVRKYFLLTTLSLYFVEITKPPYRIPYRITYILQTLPSESTVYWLQWPTYIYVSAIGPSVGSLGAAINRSTVAIAVTSQSRICLWDDRQYVYGFVSSLNLLVFKRKRGRTVQSTIDASDWNYED